MGIFPDGQWQLTMQSMIGSGQIPNSSKTLWLSSLPAKTKKNRSKIKALEYSHLKKMLFFYIFLLYDDSIVSSILSGLKTRSLELNTLGTT